MSAGKQEGTPIVLGGAVETATVLRVPEERWLFYAVNPVSSVPKGWFEKPRRL
jgi:hypothetical protein